MLGKFAFRPWKKRGKVASVADCFIGHQLKAYHGGRAFLHLFWFGFVHGFILVRGKSTLANNGGTGMYNGRGNAARGALVCHGGRGGMAGTAGVQHGGGGLA